MSSDRQDTLNKRKVFTRSDAVVGDDDNKMERTLQRSNSPKKRFSKIIQRDHSYDSLGIDILRFVENTLHKNAKDREFLLFIEEEIRKFVEDESKCYHFFPAMSSYNRMLVHRVAAFFGLSHNVDQTGQQVVVTKQKGLTRVPDIKFSCLIKHSNFEDKCHFGRRNVQSFDESNISTLGNHQNSTTNFGPPSSFRAFRNRFYTCGGQTNSTEVNKGRRTRSFEISDWSNSTASNPLWNQQFASFCHFQPSTNLEIVTAGMGDAMSSNCSSSASSGAVQLQGGGSGIPFQIYPSGQFVLANEASLISPSSAFSEPPTKQLTYQQGFTEEIEEKREEGTVAENKNNLILTTTTEAGGGGERVGGVNANIPSLFSLQQIMQQNTNIGGNNYPQNYQQFINPYLTLQYQPMLVNASSNAQYQYYNENANMLHYYPTYYPIYQPQSGIVDSNLMTGENVKDSNKPLERQLKGLSICQEQNENNNGNNNGPKYNGNNNNVAKPTCY